MSIARSHILDLGNVLAALIRKRAPGQVVLQFTDHCNARCPQCGMNVTHPFRRSRLDQDTIKRIIDASAQKGIRAISFTGGEPFLFQRELTDLINYAGKAGIRHIRTGTNGFIFADSTGEKFKLKINQLAETLSKTPLRNLWISIDSSVPSTHEEMRGFSGVIEGIREALPIFHNHGIYPSANLGINRTIVGDEKGLRLEGADHADDPEAFCETYRGAFRRFYRFIGELGFTMVSHCYPMSVEDNPLSPLKAVYAATSQDELVDFSRAEKAAIYRALLDVLPEIRSRIRVFTPLSSVYRLQEQHRNSGSAPHGCRGGIDFFFISAKDGNTYPCGYRGEENLGKLWDLDLDALDKKASCVQCDWECFRDPTELLGPVTGALARPAGFLGHLRKNKVFYQLWVKDLKYYAACHLFDGRRPPDFEKLGAFLKSQSMNFH